MLEAATRSLTILACLLFLIPGVLPKGVDVMTVQYPTHKSIDLWRADNMTFSRPHALDGVRDAQTYKQLGVSHSQFQEDQWLYENWYYGMINGVMLESGALDGNTFSNTYMFRLALDWHIIHIEGDTDNFNALKHNRKDAINIHAALCKTQQTLHFVPSNNAAVRGIWEFMPEAFRKRWHWGVDANNLPSVPCMPLPQVLSALHLQYIDLWILDVEGAEEEVLQGMDFSKLHIKGICMECDGKDNEKDARKVALLNKEGYLCEQVHLNCMCRHKSFEPSAKKTFVENVGNTAG